jgi:hypothetical protein
MYANESPGRIANVHIIASRYRKFALKDSSFRFMATYGLDGPLEPDEFLARLRIPFHNLYRTCAPASSS